jgi:hypothetical protein
MSLRFRAHRVAIRESANHFALYVFFAERLQCKRGRLSGYKSLNFDARANNIGGGAVTSPLSADLSKSEHSTVTYCSLGLPTTIFRPVGLV